MLIIGADTRDYLNTRVELREYLTELDRDLTEVGIDDNYAVLTELNVSGEELVNVMCFYMVSFPKKFNQQLLLDILEDHAGMLVSVCTHAITLFCDENNILELADNPTMKNRNALLERLVGE